ncbi:MAG: Serine protease Do-like HtrB [Firmicutes bacterium ADurb.Bin419]|nr:MAG: Serine protease Do-like HtrB [Firmicutes bacterium ADurb.Bin419]
MQEGSSSGSGIIIRSDGYIMTNNHVISEAVQKGSNKVVNGAKIEVILPNEVDKPYAATVVGRDEKTDLAVLKIDAVDLPAIELGNSDEIKVGELAVAIGNPGGLEYMGSVTAGVISGLNRTIALDQNNELKLIQTDAAINPGNSGGALVNSEGQLIGINTAKISGDGFEGLGFAIPVNKAKEITDNLIEFKYVKGRPSIGISINQSFNEDIAARYKVPAGVLVEDVSPLSGAYNAGLQRGDIITKINGTAIKTYSELNEIKNKNKVGDTIKIEVYRDGETLTMEVVLGEDKG